MTLPNFLIIGAAKSGSTSLYAYLKQHPDIFLSALKEPRFFALEGAELNFAGPGSDEIINKEAINNFEDYRRLFDGAYEKAIGEASVIYLPSTVAPARIRYYIPSVKMVAILRNPVDRAYSSYCHTVRDGWETLDFESALALEDVRISNNWPLIWHHTKAGFYYQQLCRYYKHFAREQVKIVFYEDLVGHPQALLREIFGYLEVRDDIVPDASKAHNSSSLPRSRLLDAVLRKPNPLKAVIKPLLPAGARRRIVQASLYRPEFPQHIRRSLIELFREDILQLQELTQRDLSRWLS